ncbi:MAG: helix-turn-helix domain-containing protein [Oscillospiraceae bacterium]|nr:helix-turn-helix domain-containing protein [Oscillospiraceae bacterium]
MDYARTLSERILALRKEKGMTQEALAEKLGLSFQAISKWENNQSCPDIALLPLLADIFEVSIDGLFGRTALAQQPLPISEPVFATLELPWPDDQTLRGVVAWGRKILGYEKKSFPVIDVNTAEFNWLLPISKGLMNVECQCNLHVQGDIQGDATAGNNIECGNVGGAAKAGNNIECGDVGGAAKAGNNIQCENIDGSAKAGGKIVMSKHGCIGGNAIADGRIKCGNISGNAKADGRIKCGNIGGDATADGSIVIKGR